LNLSAIIIFKVVGWGQWDIFWGDGFGVGSLSAWCGGDVTL